MDAHILGARLGQKKLFSLVNTEDRRYVRDEEWLKISEIVKTRDNYRCMECNISEETNYKLYHCALNVHHVIPFHICRKHKIDNLIALCNGCHLKIHRKYWWDEVREQKRLLESDGLDQEPSIISQF